MQHHKLPNFMQFYQATKIDFLLFKRICNFLCRSGLTQTTTSPSLFGRSKSLTTTRSSFDHNDSQNGMSDNEKKCKVSKAIVKPKLIYSIGFIKF